MASAIKGDAECASCTRRAFLTGAIAGTFALASPIVRAAPRTPRFTSYPFALGVASGYPTADGVVLWTRLAPDPLQGGGMGALPVEVAWEVAHDECFRRIARRGVTLARPEDAHSVHVEIKGSAPGRWYWYRFRTGSELSPVGRTRTAPAVGADACGPALCLRLVPALRARLLHGLSAHGPRCARPRRAPRRLHLRGLLGRTPGPRTHRCGARKSRRLPEPLRAVPIRSRSASGPRRISLGRDMG